MAEPIIRIDALSFAYPGGTKALDGIQLQVEVGESVGLVGPNGAGKTTLFLCLSGVLAVRPGMIQIAGLDPAVPAQRRSLPAKIGIVFQNSEDQLFNATVFDDVAFGPLQLGLPAEEVRRRTEEAIAQVGLGGREQRVPFHLSGGEKRRAALAGVLAMRPDVLLLDEPSQFLDPRGRRELIRLIQQLPQTKIIAAHDLDMIMDTCQRVVVVDRGQIAATGPAQAILADANLMEAHGLEVPYRLRLPTPAERG